MMKAAAIAALAIPVFCAGAAEYSAELHAARTQADLMSTRFSQVAADLEALGVRLPEAGTRPAPEVPADNADTQATAEQGMLFDAANSRLIYLGNVRVNDPRINIFAREQLHIYLQSLSSDKEEAPPAPLADAAATEQQTGDTGAAPGEAPVTAVTGSEEPAVCEPAAPPAETADEVPPARPASVVAHNVIADTINNAIYIYTPADGDEIALDSEDNQVRITPAAGQAARILADPAGNILLEGGKVVLRSVDKEGGITQLTTTGGHAYYHAATNTLHVPGKSQLIHPEGTLDCTEMLCVVLNPAEDVPPGRKGFMSQFTGLRFEGISTATAQGQVVACGKAAGERQATRAEGDELHYNGRTGECSLLGTDCRLVYGSYDVHADQGLHLLANGDIELRGSNIHGTYEREGSQPGQLLKGSFKAHANVIFRADLGTVTTEKGLSMADDEADFSCTGPAHLVLARKEGAEVPEHKPGMPNLAIAAFGEVSRARATGNVLAHRYETGTRRCIGELKAESVDTDLTTGETLLSGAPGAPLLAIYNGNHIESVPAAGESATMEMRANGDLKLNGDHITAILQGKEGTTTAKCRGYVLLIRAEDRLETGSETELKSPTAILTTNSSLHARLTTTGAPAPQKKKFPGFTFNYNGIREATTSDGCTVRTEKGSMQCTGPVHLVMDTENKGADKMMGGLKFATARGNVAVAGRDQTGRLLRASGDLLEIDAATGSKVLSGRRVTLGDAHNTHIASGPGACIRIDADNNASIHGQKHTTNATSIRQQINDNKTKNQPRKK